MGNGRVALSGGKVHRTLDATPSGSQGAYAVYRTDSKGKVSTVAKDSALNHPNGVAVLPNGTLVVVTFSVPGELYTKGPGLLEVW